MSEVNFNVSNPPSNNSYVDGAGDVGASRKPSGANLESVLPESPGGKDDVKDRGFVPDAPKANTDMAPLRGMLCASLSPGAMMAALCIKEAAKMNEQYTNDLLTRNDAVQKNMQEQAKKIEDAAFDKMILGICGAVVSAGCSIAAARITFKGGPDDIGFGKAKAIGDATAQTGASIDKIFQGIGGYVEAKAQAENKRLDAGIEQHRTIMEAVRNSMSAQRDLINKSLDFMNSMQANMNQSMTRIMG